MRATIRDAVAQLLAVGICSAVLFLFVALTYSQITLPRYTTAYNQKDAQQVINLIITIAATVIGILLSHCRRLTNEAETKSELRNEELTISRLHVHAEAAGGSKATMILPALQNKDVWRLVALYFFAMIVFGFLHSVLSVIFVIDSIISDEGEPIPAYIPLSIDIPWEWDGKPVDPCSSSWSAPGCTYDMAMTSLTSQLITYTDYTIGGVTFEPPNGTLGLPFHAMKHFQNIVESSQFEEEHRRCSYATGDCLPVLDPHIVRCIEEPFDQALGETKSNLVKYELLNVSRKDSTGNLVSVDLSEIYQVSFPYPTDGKNQKYRNNDQGLGTMLMGRDPNPDHWQTSIITASDNHGKGEGIYGYASLLYQLMYNETPNISNIAADSTYFFAAKCHLTSIKYRDNYLSSWRQVDFTLRSGVLRANVTEERCPNVRGDWTSGFGDLDYFLQGAGAVLANTDGSSNLFNLNTPHGKGSSIFDNMSRLDAVMNQIYHITQTAWTESAYKYAMMNDTVKDNPIVMLNYPHLYVIRISWTPTTYIGLVLSLLITLNAYVLAGRWLRATHRFGFKAETWNLLRPVDLMAYSLASYQDLIYDLNTIEHRRMAMRGKTQTILREHPVSKGTQNLIGLVSSTSCSRSPADGKFGRGASTVTIEEKREDLEKGSNAAP